MNTPDPVEQYLKSIPLFAMADATDKAELLRLLRPVEVKPGEVLFQQGEPGRAMWVLGKGVEVSVFATARGAQRPRVIAQVREGDTLGEMALIDDGKRSGTAVVVQGGPAHQIDAMDFATLRESYNQPVFKVLRRLCMELAQKLRATSNRVVAQREARGLTANSGRKAPYGRRIGGLRALPSPSQGGEARLGP